MVPTLSEHGLFGSVAAGRCWSQHADWGRIQAFIRHLQKCGNCESVGFGQGHESKPLASVGSQVGQFFSFTVFCFKSALCGAPKKKTEETGGFGENNCIICIFNH